MSLNIAIETFLIFPVLFVESFIAPSASIIPASSAFVASTTLHERRSFEIRCPLYKGLAVIVEEVQGMLVVLGVSVVPGSEVILQVQF